MTNTAPTNEDLIDILIDMPNSLLTCFPRAKYNSLINDVFLENNVTLEYNPFRVWLDLRMQPDFMKQLSIEVLDAIVIKFINVFQNEAKIRKKLPIELREMDSFFEDLKWLVKRYDEFNLQWLQAGSIGSDTGQQPPSEAVNAETTNDNQEDVLNPVCNRDLANSLLEMERLINLALTHSPQIHLFLEDFPQHEEEMQEFSYRLEDLFTLSPNQKSECFIDALLQMKNTNGWSVQRYLNDENSNVAKFLTENIKRLTPVFAHFKAHQRLVVGSTVSGCSKTTQRRSIPLFKL